MITYNSENALTFTIPYQEGCSIPDLKEVQSYSFGGYGSGISFIGVMQGQPQQRQPGIFVKTKPEKWGLLLGDEFQPQIYRGQNKDYPTFSTSFGRLTNDVDRIIAKVQREEFKYFFIQTPYYKRCREFTVFDCSYDFDFEAIFQHYGFKSSYIDITKELFIALFFAYTYVTADGKYHPIQDFNEYNPTLYVSLISSINNAEDVEPISLQMLGRPLKQMAMALNPKEKDLKQFFEKYELPKNSFIATDIFNKFNGGKSLFPDEPVAEVVKQIISSKELNNEILERICAESKKDINTVKVELQKHGYKLTDIHWDLTEDMRIFMNDDINGFWLNFLAKIHPRITSPMMKG